MHMFLTAFFNIPKLVRLKINYIYLETLTSN